MTRTLTASTLRNGAGAILVRPHLLLVCLALSACAGVPSKTTLHYSPPSVAPVRRAIATAQDHVKAAKAALDPGRLDLKTANSELDALTHELFNAQAALNQAEANTDAQTDALNRTIDEKNSAIDQLAAAEAKRAAAVRQRNKLFLILFTAGSALLLYIFRRPIAGLLKLALV